MDHGLFAIELGVSLNSSKDPVDASDFKLDKFMAGSTESFEPYYGVGGAEGDGDILKMTNIEEFARHVMKYSKPFGG